MTDLQVYIWKIKDFFKKEKKINKGDFSYINWWELKDEKDLWLENFIKYHFKNKIKKHINFYSVFGPYKSLRKKRSFNTIKIFFSGENVLNYRKYKSLNENEKEAKKFIRRRFIDYSKYAIDDMDISLGFSDFDNEKYIRFPLWIMYMFKPICDYKEIVEQINYINNIFNNNIYNNAVVVSSHDIFGLRTKICDDVKNILNIKYAGKWRNNTTDLWNKYNNNKLEYMKQFKFNICPENMDANQYVTEKIFEALYAGTIPIYHGAFNNPEPGIINRDRIILWDFEGDNEENIKLIKRLKNDETFYNKYITQEKLLPYTAEFVYNQMEKLKEKIKILK